MEFTTRFGLHSQATRLREASNPTPRSPGPGTPGGRYRPHTVRGLRPRSQGLGSPESAAGEGGFWSAAETAPKDAGRAARGGLGGDRDERTTAPSRAGDRDRGGPAKEEGVTTPVPRPSRPTRARQHGTVPAGYPPADSRPHGGEARGRGPRLAPPLGPLSLSALGGARSTPSLSRSLPGRRHRTAARPRRGRAPPQRLAPGAGSYGALPESAFRGTKALRGRPRPRRRPPGRRERIEAAEGNRSPRRAPTAFPPGTGRPPPPPPTAGNGPARRPQPRRRGGPRTAIDRQATLRQAETPPRVPFFGGGPGARARPGLRAEGQHGARRTAGGTAARPTSIARDDTHAHAAGGTTAVGPRTRRLPFAAPRRGRLSPAALQRSRRHAPTTAPPARPPREPLPSERPATGGRTPSPVPEADATETRAGAAGARGRPGGGPAAAAAALPGPPQPRRAVGAPSPGHAPGGRRTAPSRGATPARRAPTRRPGGEAPPRLPARPPFGPHAAGKGDGNATGEARAGTADGAGGRRPAGRPRPPGREGGTLAERRRRRSARGRPRSRASADGGTAERSPQTGWGGGRAGDVRRTAPPVRSRRRPSRGEARPRQGESGQGESAAGAGGRNPAAEERQRARALCRHRPGFEGSGSAGPAARPRAAASPPRPGRREGGAGRPSPARRGYPPPAARGGDDGGGGRAAGGNGHHRRGSAGAAPHPSVAPRHRPAHACRRRHRRRRRGGARRAARVFKPPPGPAGPFRPPRRLTTPREPGDPPRRGALGTWPWGEGDDLHGPAGVPLPLPPSGERPPAGARPTSAATTAASFSGPGVSLSSPALRPRGRPRLGPPRRRGDAARPPSTLGRPRREAAAPATGRPKPPPPPPPPHQPGGGSHARGARTRPGTPGGSALGVPPLREGPLGPRAGFRRPAASPPGPSPVAIGRRRVRRPDGRPSLDGRRSEGGGRRASGRGRAEHPSLPAPGRLSRTERREPGSGARVRTGDRRSAAPAAAAEGSGPAAPPPSGGDGPAADRRKPGEGGEESSRGGGDERAALRGPVATRGVARGEPRPRARCRARATLRRAERLLPPVRDPAPGWGVPRASISFSLGLRRAARGGLGQRAAAPSGRACGPRGRPRPAAGGRASETERACVDAARAPPAGRHGKRGGRQPPTDSQVRPSSRHSGRAVADPAGADPRTSLNHPIDLGFPGAARRVMGITPPDRQSASFMVGTTTVSDRLRTSDFRS
ncbi:collagen alpha-1(I) chain-like [Passer domesticus]|uniref:collagen alpha-1(I) chain-like n=1 Tax=Passer domesticus TaxID=48849 RepID=UPI0030FDFFF5